MIGQALAPYRITAALGAGGMGEVYRATDTKLGRDVAIKVLPSELARDPERLARFEREARLLASLNHPQIAHVCGFESSKLGDGGPQRFIAMELVEGEDLSERLKRGMIPVGEVLEIARSRRDTGTSRRGGRPPTGSGGSCPSQRLSGSRPLPANELPEPSGVEDPDPRNLTCLQEIPVACHEDVRLDRQCLAQDCRVVGIPNLHGRRRGGAIRDASRHAKERYDLSHRQLGHADLIDEDPR